MLFGLIVGRLLLTLVENRQLLQRVERSGLFEEKLRDLGGALVAALDRKNTLELVCRTAQLALARRLGHPVDARFEHRRARSRRGPRARKRETLLSAATGASKIRRRSRRG